MEELIEKISAIFFRYGIKSVTMDDLAGELGISKKTLYQHFHDKEDVVRAVIKQMIAHQSSAIEEMVSRTKLNAIEQLLDMSHFLSAHMQSVNPAMMYDLKKYYPVIWEELMRYKRETIFSHIMRNIQQGISEKLYRDDLTYEIIASVYVSRLELFASGQMEFLEDYSFRDIFKTLFVYHIRGIANESGLRFLETLISDELKHSAGTPGIIE